MTDSRVSNGAIDLTDIRNYEPRPTSDGGLAAGPDNAELVKRLTDITAEKLDSSAEDMVKMVEEQNTRP